MGRQDWTFGQYWILNVRLRLLHGPRQSTRGEACCSAFAVSTPANTGKYHVGATRILGPRHSLPAPSPCSAGASPQQAADLPAYRHPQGQGPSTLLTFPLLPSTHSTPRQLQGRSPNAVVMGTARTPRPRSIPCTPVPFQQVIPVPQLAPGPLSCKSHITHQRCLSAVKTNFTLTVQD